MHRVPFVIVSVGKTISHGPVARIEQLSRLQLDQEYSEVVVARAMILCSLSRWPIGYCTELHADLIRGKPTLIVIAELS